MKSASGLLSLFLLLSLSGCSKDDDKPAAPAAEAHVAEAPAPEPLVALTAPEVNMDKVRLGRALFHDTRLSGDNTIACVNCHSLDHGGAEALKTSTGIRGQVGPINSPTVLNAHLNFVQFWDGRAASLEEQAAGPVENPLEMGAKWPDVLAVLAADETYAAAFASLYDGGVTQANVTHAIAEYERYLTTPAPFDRYLAGDTDAISTEAREGYATFKSVGCTSCHTGAGVGGTMYQKMGLVRDYFAGREQTDADQGRFAATGKESDRHFFKVPTLRNIALTAPYFHDGSQATLADAVRSMGSYQLGRDLTDAQVSSIVAFLNTLTGELPAEARPPAAAVPPTETAVPAPTAP